MVRVSGVRSQCLATLLLVAGCASAGAASGRRGPVSIIALSVDENITQAALEDCAGEELTRMGYSRDQQGEITYYWKGGLPRRVILVGGPSEDGGRRGLILIAQTRTVTSANAPPTAEGEAEADLVIETCVPGGVVGRRDTGSGPA